MQETRILQKTRWKTSERLRDEVTSLPGINNFPPSHSGKRGNENNYRD